MSRRYAIAIASAVLGLGCLIALSREQLGSERDSNIPPSEARSSAESVASLTAEVDSLRAEVAKLKTAQLPAKSPAEAPAAPQASAASSRAEAPRSATPVEDPVPALEERILNEPEDRAWEASMKSQIHETIGSVAPGVSVTDAECGSTLCRVVVAHKTREDQIGIGRILVGQAPFKNGVYYDYDREAQPPTTTMYVLREGHAFHNNSPAEAAL